MCSPRMFGREADESESSYRVRYVVCLKADKTCRARVGKKRGGEAVIAFSLSLVPEETFGVILTVRIASVVFWDWFYCFNGAYVYIFSLLNTKPPTPQRQRGHIG